MLGLVFLGAMLVVLGGVGSLLLGGYPKLLANSSFVVLGSLAISLSLGSIAGWIVGWTDVPWRRFWISLLIAWLATPLIVQISGWDSLWGRLSWWSAATSINYTRWIDGYLAVILIHGLANTPWVALTLLAGRSVISTDPEQFAATQVSAWTNFWRISVPTHLAIFLSAALLVGLKVFEQFEVTDVYQVRTWAEVWYLGFSLGQYDSLSSLGTLEWFSQLAQMQEGPWPGQNAVPILEAGQGGATANGTPAQFQTQSTTDSGLAALFPLLMIIVGLILLAVSALRQWFPARPSVDSVNQGQIPLHRKLVPLTMLSVIVLLPQLINWLNLLIRSGLRIVQVDGTVQRQWSFSNVLNMLWFCAQDYYGAVCWSLIIGVLSATLVWGLAVPWSWLGRRSWWWTATALLVSALSLAIPAPMVSLVWYRVLFLSDSTWLSYAATTSVIGPVMAIVMKNLGFGLVFWLILFRKQPLELEDDMKMMGASAWTRFSQLGLLANVPAHLGFLLVATILGAGDLAASFATLPAGIDTLPRRILGDLHAGAGDQVAGICLLQIAFVLSLSAVTIRIWPNK